MRLRLASTAIIATLFASGLSLQAKLLVESDAAMAVRLEQSISHILKAMRLSGQDADFARRAALTWFYVGPCKATDAAATEGFGTLQSVMGGNPNHHLSIAVWAIVGMISSGANLGREPSAAICNIVKGLAFPLQSSQ